ncbi:MAG: hypothetical protein Q9175_001306 [Cornicularia normoerica]
MMWTIYKLMKDNGRKERSIVTASKGSLDLIVSPLDPEEDNLWQAVHPATKFLRCLRVEISFAAGNDALHLNAARRQRTLVETAPTVFSLYEASLAFVAVGSSAPLITGVLVDLMAVGEIATELRFEYVNRFLPTRAG